MEWENSRESTNVEDQRGSSGGGGLGIPIGGGTGGLGIGVILILALIGYFTGIDPRILIGGAQILVGNGAGNTSSYSAPAPAPTPTAMQPQQSAQNDLMRHFVAVILGQTEDVWSQVLPAQKGVAYTAPKLVLYSGSTRSGCGTAQSAMGPFYCPNDKKVYLDMAFFNDMRDKYGGGGDFAYAYVIAHEIGHHVQDLLGILDKADAAKQNMSRTQANAVSVRIELMADCLAGVWAANADQKWHILDPGDVEKAMATASAIGDDRLQTAAKGYAVPDSFTHGSSALRQQWLTTGLKSGQVDSCNTFAQ
ncbi:neutral zinc metallopeptidase [Methylocapsa sp. S129]|uniref:KPN_02809 family neutral zinc metallopeptidase n=1 Tax=Methylocapsa sp. S129 TaxID=1641869 RepID=UPI00131E1C04|nr:neutral zinc metallopeptidase [Methylocapsa sp. S129]